MKVSFLLLAVPLALSACEPFTGTATWHADDAVQANLDASAVDKVDTVAGHGDKGSDATLDAAAIQRLYTDKPRKLPEETTTSSVTGSSSGSGGGSQ